MTEQESLAELKSFPVNCLDFKEHMALDMAIEALEKQIAKKPEPINYEKYIDVVENAKFLRGAYWCPNCKHTVRSGTYCDDCGQKLDWSEV